MKRKISLILCACFLMSCMVVPAAASENDNFINVLDYCTADDSGSNYITGDNTATSDTFTYSCPVGPFRYVDMIIQTVNGPLSSLSVNGTDLTVLQIKTNFYRAYGAINLSSDLTFTATSTAANTRYNITHFKASFLKSFASADTGFFALSTPIANSPFQYMQDADTSAKLLFSAVDGDIGLNFADPSVRNFTVYGYVGNWKKYDLIDMYFSVRAASLNSLAVTFGDQALPFELSYINSSGELAYIDEVLEGPSGEMIFDYDMLPAETLYFHVSIDASDLDRTSSDTPQVCFSGQYSMEDTNQHVTLLSVVGTVENDSQNSDTYWFMQLFDVLDTFRAYTLYYLRQLQTSIDTGFTNIGTWFSDLTVSIQGQTESIVAALGDLDTSFAGIQTWIQEQTTSIDRFFVLLRSNISTNFDELRADLGSLSSDIDTWIQEQTTSIDRFFVLLRSNISTNFDELRADLTALRTDIDTWIQEQTTVLQNEFMMLRSDLDSEFTQLTKDLQLSLLNVRASIDTLNDNLNTWIKDQTAAIQEEFRLFRIAISTHFDRLKTQIEEQTAALEAAIRGDTAPGDAFQNEVAEKDEQFDEMADVMDSVVKPELSADDFNVSGYVAAADVSALTAPLMVFFTGDVFGPIIMMVMILATVSYVLYGKRG